MVPHIVFHVPNPDYSPGPELWGLRRLRRRPRGRDERDHAAACARDGGAGPARGRPRPRVPRGGRAGARALAPLAAHDSRERGRPRGRPAPLGGGRQLASLRRGSRKARRRGVDCSRAHGPARGGGRAEANGRRLRRYRFLVEHLRERAYRPASLEDQPFVFVDLTFNSILATAEDDLAELWRELGADGRRAREAAQGIRGALSERWDDRRALYVEDGGDESAGETIDGLFPLYGRVPSAEQARRLFDEALWAPERFGPSPEAPWPVTSASKASLAFDARRYWRGPVWVNVNWFLARGLEQAGLGEEARQLAELTLELVIAIRVRRVLRADNRRAARRSGLLLERRAHDRPPPPPAGMSYDVNPRYPVVVGAVESGFEPFAAEIAREDLACWRSTGLRLFPGTRSSRPSAPPSHAGRRRTARGRA